jgi:hypothetical protein
MRHFLSRPLLLYIPRGESSTVVQNSRNNFFISALILYAWLCAAGSQKPAAYSGVSFFSIFSCFF